MGLGRTAATLAMVPLLVLADGATADDPTPAPPHERETLSGFRMEGAAHVSVVFGDIEAYRDHVDQFYELDEELRAARQTFADRVQSILGGLSAARRGRCPTEAVAAHWARADQERERFERAGADYQVRYRAIRELDGIGDTAGLTPDYRWKVNKTRGMFRRALSDLRELRATWSHQLRRELRHKGCRNAALREAAATADPTGDETSRPINPMPAPRRYHTRVAPEASHARDVTFYVDNKRCDDPLTVYLDGELLGIVEGRGRGAFRTLAGRHSMCLLSGLTTTACGQQGTVRHAFVYDGWSISLHCLD